MEDTNSEPDIQLGPEQGEQEQAQKPAQRDKAPEEGEDDQQQQVVQAGPMRSERAPTRYGNSQHGQEGHNQLSPRERKRIKSLAVRKVPRERGVEDSSEWKVEELQERH